MTPVLEMITDDLVISPQELELRSLLAFSERGTQADANGRCRYSLEAIFTEPHRNLFV
jgi:hypothetical protein